jgi:hypothetical protein
MDADIYERNELRQVTRYPLAVHRDCAMCVITFKDLSWKDQFAFLKDISTSGVGVESEKPMDPGFVWFHERVGGHRGGILMWGRQVGYNYRAGIEFVPLSREAEQFVHDQVGLLRAHQPLLDAEAIMTTIIGSLSKTRKH